MAASERNEAWIRLPDPEQLRAAPGAKPHPYDAFMDGKVAHMSRLLAAHPLLGPAFRQLSAAVLFGPGALTRPEREMVAAVAAAAQDCVY
jgi:hypothetical protein